MSMYRTDTIRRVLNRDEILVAGHRGMKALYPENTLLSMREALLHGVDMIETDLNLTKDKEVVVMHDNTVDRTTNGTGFIRDMTLEEFRRLDAGAPWGEAFRGLKAPTLREFCEFISPWKQLLLNVEIKEKTQETVDLAFEILREFDLMERCVFTCFDAAIVEYMADRYGVLIQGFPKEYMENFREGPNGTYSKLFAVGISMYQFSGKPDMRLLSKELVREFEEMGIEPWAFCPDDEASIRYAVDCGARLVTCNNPLPALDYLTRNDLHPNRIESPVSPLL